MHAGRRNSDMTLVLFDNSVYGLTKGQASPTTPKGDKMKLAYYGVPEAPIHPISLAIQYGATFAARGFSAAPAELTPLLAQAIQHRGFSLVQVISPCVTFRGKFKPLEEVKLNRADVPADHDVSDRSAAMTLADQTDQVYLGVLYERTDLPTYEDLMLDIETEARVEGICSVEDVLDNFVR